jgi:hypothetical protein
VLLAGCAALVVESYAALVHSGGRVNMTFLPAPPNSGIRFRRIDLDGKPEIEARVENVSVTNRSTTLAKANAKIQTTSWLRRNNKALLDYIDEWFVFGLKRARLLQGDKCREAQWIAKKNRCPGPSSWRIATSGLFDSASIRN